MPDGSLLSIAKLQSATENKIHLQKTAQ